jgi:NAD(P)-dependent dehydrogenase (short-subunit alcohol dehydrogenase family)
MQGKVVAITGASQGIGAAAARAFAAAGAQVALLARSEAAIAALAQGIGPAALALPCDVTDAAQVDRALARAAERFGGLDVMVANAGRIDPIARLADADPADWAQGIAVNLTGVYNGMRAAIPHLRARGGGTFITVSSGAATTPLEGWSAYCAGKAGALMLTRCLHLEEGPNGIRALGLSPGTVATAMQVRIRESGVNPVSRLDPSAHIPPEWPARALVWMCSPEADAWLGHDISLRDPEVRRRVGLPA